MLNTIHLIDPYFEVNRFGHTSLYIKGTNMLILVSSAVV